MSFALSQYRSARTQTASPVRVLVQLYDGALRFLQEAKSAIPEKDMAKKGVAISKAYAIVAELGATLDSDKAPELCEQLSGLYDFALHEITQANISNDAARLDGPISVLSELRDAWAQIADGKVAP
ncbi:MAG: flagellar export chaperone FliS [Deltaproteobacteria bacterium]|nr:flagellar export chaperone FliS [Deltaproteobacteria bacterium]